MKKIGLLLLSIASFVSTGNAAILDNIKLTLLDHVSVMTQFDFRGTTRLTLLDSVVQIGRKDGEHLVSLQGGVTGDTKPEDGGTTGANFVAGAFFRVDPFLKKTLNLAPHWEFLRTVQHGPAVLYDFRERETYYSYQVGFAFDPNPKP